MKRKFLHNIAKHKNSLSKSNKPLRNEFKFVSFPTTTTQPSNVAFESSTVEQPLFNPPPTASCTNCNPHDVDDGGEVTTTLDHDKIVFRD